MASKAGSGKRKRDAGSENAGESEDQGIIVKEDPNGDGDDNDRNLATSASKSSDDEAADQQLQLENVKTQAIRKKHGSNYRKPSIEEAEDVEVEEMEAKKAKRNGVKIEDGEDESDVEFVGARKRGRKGRGCGMP